MNTIYWSKKAIKQVEQISPYIRIKIVEKARFLASFPHSANVQKIATNRYEFNLGIGAYKIYFSHDGDIKISSVEEVKNQDEKTY